MLMFNLKLGAYFNSLKTVCFNPFLANYKEVGGACFGSCLFFLGFKNS